jgi:hypothetical protein
MMEEYLEYQRSISELLQPPETLQRTLPSLPDGVEGSRQSRSIENAAYPSSCLLFVQNLPESTNKTALKAIFNEALDGDGQVDYVDWDKGKIHVSPLE